MVKKGFQQTEIGIIPNDWILKKIKDFTDVTSGGTPSTFVPEYWNGEIRWMNSGEINLKKIYEVNGRITKLGLKNSSTKLIPKNCILIALAGQGKTRGTVAINHVELCINQSLGAIIPNKSFVPEYLYHNLDSRYDEFRNLSSGGEGRGGLNLTLIKNIHIPLPISIEEQKLIAKNLNDVDQVIEKFEKLIEKKKNIKQGAMQELLTGKRRLSGFSGKWEIKKLGDCLIKKPEYGINASAVKYSDNLHVYIRITDISEDGTFIHENKTSVNHPTSDQFILETGDIVFARTGASTGKTYLYDPEDGKLVFAGFLIRVKTDPKKLVPEYLKIFTETRTYWNWVKKTSMRSGQAGINGTEYSELIILTPPIKEQIAIGEIILDIDSEIKKLEKNRDKYIMIKNGMMQKLLTGEIRLV